MLKYLRGGLGGPPIFVACQSISIVVKMKTSAQKYFISCYCTFCFLTSFQVTVHASPTSSSDNSTPHTKELGFWYSH
jgi:hypothetical protein